ncbi:MAG: hypothetical protein ABS87_14550 [Sphingomonas sp. SCN 67-18]|uniref:ester cyclase n=1 Tax=uncultured Sphingomonas sp. TaxID=158754 RepID=UPI000869508D|nr:ester cyclase [Sphingomonas sp. SCN 67-18]ODU18700.1 MAG: hypothetical protein ABS87_14550 [Sphingomonas sp. SCN 67-18]
MIPGGISERLYAAYNGHDIDALERLYAADGTHEDVAQGRPKRGARAIAEGFGRFLGWFPDAHWEAQEEIVDLHGRIAIPYRLTASLQADMGPISARGQQIALRGVHILHVAGDHIQRSEDYWDASTFQRQINSIETEKKA